MQGAGSHKAATGAAATAAAAGGAAARGVTRGAAAAATLSISGRECGTQEGELPPSNPIKPNANLCFCPAHIQRQRLKLKLQYQQMEATPQHMEQPLCEMPLPQPQANVGSTHDMDLLMEQLSSTCTDGSDVSSTATASLAASIAPRDSILLKIRHQIFERKRQRQRQLGELVKQRLVVWRPW